MKTINTLLYIMLAGLMTLFASNANAQQSWDFSTMSQADKDACAADANWVLGSDRYCYIKGLDNEPLIANGTELEYTKSLKFTAAEPSAPEEGKAKIRCNYGSKRLELNGTGVILIIPNLKVGQYVEVYCMTGKTNSPRGLSATNLSGTTGFGETSAEELTCTGTVTADGDVTLTTLEGGMYIYNITVTGEGGEVTPPESDYNDVSQNITKNQVRLTVGSDIKYYNTDEVKITFDKTANTVTVTPISGSWQDVYTKTVSNIDFALAQPTGGEGDIQEGEIKITEAKGWQESLYAKWEPYNGATSYNVYVKGGLYSDYTKIDEQLVRDYGTYCRADVVGLVAGSDYTIKVIAVDGEEKEIENSATEATGIEVINYERTGYAHFNYNEGVGAYNNDGSLKADAKVLYITKDNCNTISMEVEGADNSPCVGLGQILKGREKGKDSTPLAIRFIGIISNNDLASSQRLSDQDGLQLKGKNNTIDQNITFEGIGDDATISGFGIALVKARGVEIRNLGFMLFKDDGISLKEDSHIWIHNNDIFYGNAGSASDQAKGDGSLDVKDDSQYCTFSYIHFWDSGKSSLCGMKSESGENWITYHHNWFDHTDSRTPRVRTMTVHVWNNYYDGVSKYGVGATMGSSIFVENNYFRNTNKPMMISLQGSDISGDGDGTFSGENGGMIKSYGNVFVEKSNNFRYVTYQQDHTQFDAYEATSRDEQVPNDVQTLKGGNTYNNFDTNSSLIYDYTPDDAANVPSLVTGYYGAGRLNHGDFQWTFNNAVDDSDYDVNEDLKKALQNYETSLVKIFGDENAASGEEGNEGGETGGETGGEQGSETGEEQGGEDNPDVPVVEGTVTCHFTGSQVSNPAFNVTKNGGEAGFTSDTNKYGSAIVNGTEYTDGLKLETGTSIKFTTAQKMTMTLYYGSKCEKCSIKIDGEKTSGDVSTHTLTATLEAGEHELTKQDTGVIYFIKLVPVE